MYVDISKPDISKGSWCESCARKNNCYAVVNRPKCFVPTTNTSIVCPKCGKTEYIRSFELDFQIPSSEYKYKCINCNTYIR